MLGFCFFLFFSKLIFSKLFFKINVFLFGFFSNVFLIFKLISFLSFILFRKHLLNNIYIFCYAFKF